MLKTSLRKVGGSVMLVVPPALLNLLNLQAGSVVEIGVEGDRLVIESRKKPQYTMAQLLAESEYPPVRSSEEQEWLDAPPVGGELM